MARNYTNIGTDVDAWVAETEQRMMAVARASITDVVQDAQKQTGEGGRMRVRTGFLRNSGIAKIGSLPSGNGVRPADAKPGQYQWNIDGLTAVLAALKLEDTFYFGWVARYARARELHDGFLEGALQNWSKIVARNISELRKRSKL